MRTLRTALVRFTDERHDVSSKDLQQLSVALKHFERLAGRVPIDKLRPGHVRKAMRLLRESGRSKRTANNCRAGILRLWRFARTKPWGAPRFDPAEIPKFKENPPRPTAWRPDEMRRIIDQCRKAPTKRAWGPREWLGLVLLCYDTGQRIDSICLGDVSQFNPERGTLEIPGEHQKNGLATIHTLAPATVTAVLSMRRKDGDTRLIPWPFCKRALWDKFKAQILIPAGLPAGRRDMFHKFRRTGFTHVYIKLGAKAAARYAGHKGDLSRYYLDETLLDRPDPITALPRPD